MATASNLRSLRYRDLLALPDDGGRYELHDGCLVAMAGAGRLHQAALGDIHAQLHAQLRGHRCRVYLAPLDLRLPKPGEGEGEESTVLQPDLMIVCKRSNERERSIVGAPDFVLELSSPSTASRDHLLKRRLYEAAGVTEYWIYDPLSRLLHRYQRDGEGYGPAEIGVGEGVVAFASLPLAVDFAVVSGPESVD